MLLVLTDGDIEVPSMGMICVRWSVTVLIPLLKLLSSFFAPFPHALYEWLSRYLGSLSSSPACSYLNTWTFRITACNVTVFLSGDWRCPRPQRGGDRQDTLNPIEQ